MAKRFQLKHQTMEGRPQPPAADGGQDRSEAPRPHAIGISLSSEEACRLVQDLNGWRHLSSKRPAHREAESVDLLEAEAAEFAQLVILQARRRSRLAIQLAMGPTRRRSDSDGARLASSQPVRPTRLEALMIDRPELAAELRFLIDQGLDRNRQPSMRQLHVLLLTRLRSWRAAGEDQSTLSSGLGYAAFCAWVQRARISGREDV